MPHDSPESNYRLAREALLEQVGAVNANYPMRCDEGPDPYQLRLGELGRLDLVHLGLGADGHTASLFPGSPGLDADPGRLVVMNEDPTGRNPHPRMTLTFAGIARARLVLVTVAGEEKREALARVRAGDADVPAAPTSTPSGSSGSPTRAAGCDLRLEADDRVPPCTGRLACAATSPPSRSPR